MYLTIPTIAIVAILFLVFCALVCTGVLTRRVKGYKNDFLEEQKARDDLADKLQLEKQDHSQTKRDLEIRGRAVTDLQERIKGLEELLAARNAEITRLQRLVTKAEQDAADAREERDNQTNRANDESITRMNAQAELARARMGEDPDTDTFYAQKYAVHIAIGPDAETAAPVEAEPDSGAAAAPAEKETAPAEAQAKPQTVKKSKTKK